jgi:hypothetical protein
MKIAIRQAKYEDISCMRMLVLLAACDETRPGFFDPMHYNKCQYQYSIMIVAVFLNFSH